MDLGFIFFVISSFLCCCNNFFSCFRLFWFFNSLFLRLRFGLRLRFFSLELKLTCIQHKIQSQ